MNFQDELDERYNNAIQKKESAMGDLEGLIDENPRCSGKIIISVDGDVADQGVIQRTIEKVLKAEMEASRAAFVARLKDFHNGECNKINYD